MKRKVSTLLEENLYRRAKAESSRRGVPLSEIIGEALDAYLNQKCKSESGSSVVAESWAVLRMPLPLVEKILGEEGDLY